MKRKVGELNNIPIVEGDPNLLKTNELLHKGGGQLSKRNKEGNIQDLTSNSSDFIYVGFKKFQLQGDFSDICSEMLNWSVGIKYTNACYLYWGIPYGYEGFDIMEYVVAINVPVIPEFSNNIENNSSFYTFSQFRDVFLSLGYTEEDFDSNFYEITKEEFFTQYIDILTLQIDDKELIVDFAARKWFLTGEGWKDIDKDTNTVSVVSLLRLPYEYSQVIYNNVKYETTTNNYVVYGRFSGSYIFTNSRLKTNGVGPDPNYPKLDGAKAFMHSSGIQVNVMM